jgi:GDSL-like Lipase/Acylhydrolase family
LSQESPRGPVTEDTDQSPPPRNSWRAKLLLAIVATLFALALGEAGLRLYFWQKGVGRGDIREVLERSRASGAVLDGGAGLFGLVEPSPFPEVIYQLKPNLRGIHKGAHVETNRFGLRGPEIEQEKPAHTVRVVGLGDSHMFGWGVEQEEIYTARLERLLDAHAEPGWRFEVLNFGTPGYNCVLEVATFEKRALAFDPDVVLLHFVGNDLDAPHFLAPPPALAPSRWYLVELLRGLFAHRTEGNAIEGGDEESDDADVAEDSAADDAPSAGNAESGAAEGGRAAAPGTRAQYKSLRGKGPYREAIERLAELTRARGIPVLSFRLGSGSGLRRWSEQVSEAAGFRTLDAAPEFVALLRERGIEPTEENFRQAYAGVESHPSSLGHEAYARALLCELEAMHVAHLGPAPELCRLD